MNLHIFNPEHDLALAANLRQFTAPHAGRQLRSDLAFIPVFVLMRVILYWWMT